MKISALTFVLGCLFYLGLKKTLDLQKSCFKRPTINTKVFPAKLSQMDLFAGKLSDLNFNKRVYEYELSTPLFTDYAHKLRSVYLPKGTVMEYNGEGLLLFPDNAIISKTFYYQNDERDIDKGRRIIETRLLVKKEGEWQVGKYVWNDEQTEAFLEEKAKNVPVKWFDESGKEHSINYQIPSNEDCKQCHVVFKELRPIGVKARMLNFEYKGKNQLEYFKKKKLLKGALKASEITSLPNWLDNSFTLEERARAYLDVNCAHCHQPGGSAERAVGNSFEFRYETTLVDTHISKYRNEIIRRMKIQKPNYKMPLIGTTTLHEEGFDLVREYIMNLK